MSSDPTFVGRLMASRFAVALVSAMPVPLAWARPWMTRDNARETAKDSWQRLRDPSEAPRYAVVRTMVERYAGDGFVLDVGCSQGILAEGLAYGRYLGVDADPGSVERASRKADARTAFAVGDASTYVDPSPPDAVVLNEVVYYLPDPIAAVLHHAAHVAPAGVVVVSVFARSWASRRLLRRLASELEVLDSATAVSRQLAWTVTAYRSRTSRTA